MKLIKTIWLCLTLLAFVPSYVIADNTLEVWMDKHLEFNADGTTVTYLTVHQKDPNVNYIAYNMVITLPKGVSIHQVKSGRKYKNDIQQSVRATETHIIGCNMPVEGMLKVICSSSMNEELYPDDEDGNPVDDLFTIGLVADASTINGVYDIEMTEILFVKKDENGIPTGAEIDHVEYSQATVTGGTDFPGVSYTLSPLGIGTLIVPFSFVPQSGFEVYNCTGLNGSSIQLEKVEEAQANTPYIVRGTPGTYHLNGNYCGLNDSYSTPYLTGVYVDSKVPEGAYVMQNQEIDGLGFYQVAKGQNITINPYRCYLNEQKVAFSQLKFDFGATTGIDDIVGESSERVDVYSVSGILIRSKVKAKDALKGLQPGVYVVNNKRVTIR